MEADSDSSSSESEEDPELQEYVNQCVCAVGKMGIYQAEVRHLSHA